MNTELSQATKKILEAITIQGRKREWVYEQLGITQPTFSNRIHKHTWTKSELIHLENLLGINLKNETL